MDRQAGTNTNSYIETNRRTGGQTSIWLDRQTENLTDGQRDYTWTDRLAQIHTVI